MPARPATASVAFVAPAALPRSLARFLAGSRLGRWPGLVETRTQRGADRHRARRTESSQASCRTPILRWSGAQSPRHSTTGTVLGRASSLPEATPLLPPPTPSSVTRGTSSQIEGLKA
ncbi:hypothetical protein GQ53DRAFT_461252 [Thozetella sp. PMI_491]|nr:hypothetical protein GQ53DRAFT_461252 [Thozetella sp. PMI_491]